MSLTRIGCPHYLNTVPLIEGLDAWKHTEITTDVPAALIDRLVSGEIDLGLCSVIDSINAPIPLAILPIGMIGSDGPTHTVRLYSRVPIDQITRLHADSDSHTSVVLAQIILDRMHGLRPTVETFDARHRAGAWPETVLLIGDKVVRDPPPADDFPHRLDLGASWRELTGLPFVYAAWLCRAEDAARTDVIDAAHVLERQRRHNTTRLDWIVRTHAPSHEWPIEEAGTYLGSSLRYAVGAREREAVELFLADARSLALAPETPAVWVDL